MVAPILIPVLTKLAESGLDLIASAVISKGRDVVEKELGVNLETTATPELQKAQMDHEERLLQLALDEKKLDGDYYKVDAEDRNSARVREATIIASDTDWFNRSIASVLALCVIIGGGTFLYFSGDADIKYGVIALMSSVLTYYFGSSKTSAQKDVAINNLSRK